MDIIVTLLIYALYCYLVMHKSILALLAALASSLLLVVPSLNSAIVVIVILWLGVTWAAYLAKLQNILVQLLGLGGVMLVISIVENFVVLLCLSAIWAPYIVRHITSTTYRGASVSTSAQRLIYTAIVILIPTTVILGFTAYAVTQDIVLDALPGWLKWPIVAVGGAWAGVKWLSRSGHR